MTTRQRAFIVDQWSTQPQRRARTGCALLLCLFGTACDRGGSVTISGDVGGLDTLGYRGDSLLARADRNGERLLDSLLLRKPASAIDSSSSAGTQANTATAAMKKPEPTAGDIMTMRAQARGDSMARAVAQRLAGGNDLKGKTRADSVRGIVALVGTAPGQQLVLLVDGKPIALSGMATTGMSRLAGVEVMARGMMITPRDIVVSDYVVRASDGVPAYDGFLEQDGSLRLKDGSGRKRLPVVPPALSGYVGGRIWVAFEKGSARPHAYGYIGRR